MALRIFCLLSLLAVSHAEIFPLFDPRIINGEDAKEGEIPYQISLQNKLSSSHLCGGSILNDDYVITAAHCVDGTSADVIKVVAGSINLNSPKSEHNVAKIIVHEKYDPFDSWKNDIALLKVTTPFKTSATLGHVPLPPKGHVVKANDVAVVSGWGSTRQGGSTVTKLQRVNIFIVDQDECRNMHKGFGFKIHPTHVCAYDPQAKKGACHGDSGGPLTVDGKLVGLTSWAVICASPYIPTVYTRVGSYLDWIKDNAV